jgi:hypothetical protein
MKRTVTVLTDDLDGTPDAETVTFSLNGTRYELELSTENQQAMRDALAPYVQHARKVGKGSGRKRSS